ncbi:hypothetical protein KAR91_20495 [Candidatus Pacearchaeota archaeon]|nr:hypothetical protein [Candidatus Pacearchaeota archaeon]
MMAISREVLEREIAGTKAAIEGSKNTIDIHEIVLKAFEKELKKLPAAPKPKPAKA